MNLENVKRISNQYVHINGRKSHEILKAIQQDKSIDTISLPDNINIHAVEKLKLLYKEKKKEIEKLYTKGTYPANLPFYHILKEKYATFSWELLGRGTNCNSIPKVKIEVPRVNNFRLSLAELLINDVAGNIDTPLHRRYPCTDQLPPALVSSLFNLIKNLQLIYPDPNTMEQIVGWLQKGLNGEPLTLFSPVCPDYSVEKTDDPHCPYRYTFNELGSGVGLVARRILEALPAFNELFKSYSLNVTSVVGIGDFEALHEANLKKVNLTLKEFLSKVQRSLDVIQEESEIPLQTFMFTDLCEGHEAWNDYLRKFEGMFANNDYGKANLDQERLLKIIRARKPLYDCWYKEHEKLEDYLPQLLKQGAEYAAMGEIVSKQYKNCLVLGADHSVMGTFYNVSQPLPMVYLKRSY